MDVDFVFCKQKTAYEMRISDWSSDVCSSDLNALPLPLAPMRGAMNVLTGDFILAADGLHGLANSAPSITAIAPAAWLVPQDTLHSIAGQTVTLLGGHVPQRSEEHTSELQSLMRISYAVFCLKKKIPPNIIRLRPRIYRSTS